MLLWTKNSSFCEKLSKFCINRANKNKAQMWFWRLASNYVWGCSRGNVWLIWLKFSDNVGMILVFIWYSHQKILRPTSSPQTAHLKCLKTYWLRCISLHFWQFVVCYSLLKAFGVHCGALASKQSLFTLFQSMKLGLTQKISTQTQNHYVLSTQ